MCGCNNVISSSTLSLYNLQEFFCTSWPGYCNEGLERYQEQHTEETPQQNTDSIKDDHDTISKEIHNKIGAKTEENNNDITVASIRSKLRHSSPLLSGPEEELPELLSTSVITAQEYQAGVSSSPGYSPSSYQARPSPGPSPGTSSSSYQTLPNSPLLSPQLVLSIVRKEQDRKEGEGRMTMTNTSVSITIGHTTQIHVVDKNSRDKIIRAEDKTRIEYIRDTLEHNQCNSEVTVNGHHLCGKRILKNCY